MKLFRPEDFPDGYYDLIVNVDSLPEIATSIADSYLDCIRRCAGLFLSINQEALNQRTSTPGDLQEPVASMIDRVGGYRRLYRAPFWVRRGYVEELYEPIRSAGQAISLSPRTSNSH